MGIIKSVKQFVTKSFGGGETIKLTDQNIDPRLYRLLGTDYKFGTQSRDFLLEAYGLNPYVFMVIDRITQRMVQIDKQLLNSLGDEIEDPAFMELFKKPNSREDGNALLYRAAATNLAAGEFFMIRKQELGESDQYFVPINYNVQINEDTSGNVINYWVTMFGKSETYLPNEVLHIAKPDITFDTNRGFSSLRATRKVWESNNEVWASEATLHRNKGIAGVLYSDGNRAMTKTEQKELQKEYDETYTGADSFGKVKVSTAQLKYVQMGMNPNDLKSIETRSEHLRTICASFNVDSKIFGDPGSTTYNNMAEANRAFVISAVLPLSKLILPQIVKFMSVSVFKMHSMKLNEDDIHELQITKEQQSARLGREVLQGIIKPREARAKLYPELEENEEEVTTLTETQTPSVSDLLELQRAIDEDRLTTEGAITILIQLYGFDESAAKEILS